MYFEGGSSVVFFFTNGKLQTISTAKKSTEKLGLLTQLETMKS